MSLTSSSMSMSFDGDANDVKFVNLNPNLKCVCCRQWLKTPHQLACGHRACLRCVNKLFDDQTCETSMGYPCPSGEDGCEPSTRDQIHPDPSAVRELKRSKVFCPYNEYGCKEQPDFSTLKEHIQNCKSVKNCPHCNQVLLPSRINDHIQNICPNAPVECEFKCNMSKLPRWKMEEHYKECPRKLHRCKYYSMGCNTELVRAEMLRHDEDHAVHLQLLVKHLEDLDVKTKELLNSFQSTQSEFELLRQQFELLVQEKDSLQRTIDSQRSTEAQVQQSESLESQLSALRTRCDDIETKIRRLPEQQQSEAIGFPEDVRKKFMSQDRTIGLHELRLSEFDLRLQCAETANYEGVLIWKIGEYEDRKRQAVQGRVLSLYSQPFYTSRYGYKMCARAYLNGDGAGKNTHLSLFFVVMQGDYDEILTWPFRQRVTLNLLDQVNNRRATSDTFRPDPNSSSFQKPTSPMNVASGCPMFVKQTILESPNEPYLRNNTIFIKVVVDTSDLLPP